MLGLPALFARPRGLRHQVMLPARAEVETRPRQPFAPQRTSAHGRARRSEARSQVTLSPPRSPRSARVAPRATARRVHGPPRATFASRSTAKANGTVNTMSRGARRRERRVGFCEEGGRSDSKDNGPLDHYGAKTMKRNKLGWFVMALLVSVSAAVGCGAPEDPSGAESTLAEALATEHAPLYEVGVQFQGEMQADGAGSPRAGTPPERRRRRARCRCGSSGPGRARRLRRPRSRSESARRSGPRG